MIALLSDKFKGTLTAEQVDSTIGEVLRAHTSEQIISAPMADGGEGTAAALQAAPVPDGMYYAFTDSDGRRCAYVPSCGEGLAWQAEICDRSLPLRQRTSEPVGRAIASALDARVFPRVYVGIGGTSTADAGIGMLAALGINEPERRRLCREKIVGLADVRAPLYGPGLSAMSFLAQKGADTTDMRYCARLFRLLSEVHPSPAPHGGAGGGIGFGLEAILGARCLDGAEYILHRALAAMPAPRLIITGEGCLDSQTAGGKVVDTIDRYCLLHGIAFAAFCGTIAPGAQRPGAFATIPYGQPLPADPAEALRRCTEQNIHTLL